MVEEECKRIPAAGRRDQASCPDRDHDQKRREEARQAALTKTVTTSEEEEEARQAALARATNSDQRRSQAGCRDKGHVTTREEKKPGKLL